MILLTITLLSTVLGILATWRVLGWHPRESLRQQSFPKVSIIKPIRGLEPDLEINLHSFFNLNPRFPYELLLCVKNPEDPAVAVCEKLIAMHPQVEAKLFTGTPDLGRNPKVSNMHYAWNRAQCDLLLISDSNVKVEPDYLEVLHSERKEGAGLVTQAVYGVDAQGSGGHLDVIHLNTFYLKATAFLEMAGYDNVLGKCMMFSRSQFENLGGLNAVRNYLAEDLVSGDLMREAGHTVKLAPQLLRQTSVINSFEGYWNRHVRWARLRKCHVPFAYLTEPLLFETIWPIALILVNPVEYSGWIGALCLLAQFECNIALHAFKFKDRGAWASLPWFIFKDITAPLIWIGGLVSNKVTWRGQELRLRFGGKLASRRASRFNIARRRILARIRA
jgi:ceramide glucosyltransferase